MNGWPAWTRVLVFAVAALLLADGVALLSTYTGSVATALAPIVVATLLGITAAQLRPTTRARRAERRGEIGKALSIYAQAHDTRRLFEVLDSHLPEWPIRATIRGTTAELIELQSSMAKVGQDGVLPKMTRDLAQRADEAAEALWQTVDQVVAVSRQGMSYTDLHQTLDRENAKIADLRNAIREARL